MPVLSTAAVASIDADVAIAVHLAGFDHSGEEDTGCHATSIDGRTADRHHLEKRFFAVEPVDVVGFERSVGSEVESIFGRNGGDRAGLLLPLQHCFDPAEIAGGAQDAAFVAIVDRKSTRL